MENALATSDNEQYRCQPNSDDGLAESLSGVGAEEGMGGSYYDLEPTTLSLEGMNAADAAIDELPEIQRQLLMVHFGLTADFDSLQEVAIHNGLTDEELREHLKEALVAVFRSGVP